MRLITRLNGSLYGNFSSSATQQLCNLLHTTKPKITIRMRNVQNQSGSNNCGLFTVAFAVCLCAGKKDPCTFKWSQECMRSHLCDCLSNKAMSLFPGNSCKPSVVVNNTLKISVSCSCHMPETQNMVQCSQCVERFHRKCESIPRTKGGILPAWPCRNCWSGKANYCGRNGGN